MNPQSDENSAVKTYTVVGPNNEPLDNEFPPSENIEIMSFRKVRYSSQNQLIASPSLELFESSKNYTENTER